MNRRDAAIALLVLLAIVFLATGVSERREMRRAAERHQRAFVQKAADFLGVNDWQLSVMTAAYAATPATAFRYELGLTGQVITNPVAATFLTVPASAQHAWILVKGNPACWSSGAAAPTATSGGEWPAGALIKIDNDPLFLKALRVINCAEGATTVKVYYSRERRVADQ